MRVKKHIVLAAAGGQRGCDARLRDHQIGNAITAGSAEGMISMDQSSLNLYKNKQVSKEVALEYADNPDQSKRRLV